MGKLRKTIKNSTNANELKQIYKDDKNTAYLLTQNPNTPSDVLRNIYYNDCFNYADYYYLVRNPSLDADIFYEKLLYLTFADHYDLFTAAEIPQIIIEILSSPSVYKNIVPKLLQEIDEILIELFNNNDIKNLINSERAIYEAYETEMTFTPFYKTARNKCDELLAKYTCPICNTRFIGDDIDTKNTFAVHLDLEQDKGNLINNDLLKFVNIS